MTFVRRWSKKPVEAIMARSQPANDWPLRPIAEVPSSNSSSLFPAKACSMTTSPRYPAGGTQHIAFRLPVNDFVRVTSDLHGQGYAIIIEVDHPIARMAFFDTYQTLGVATEIMGITKRRRKGSIADERKKWLGAMT